MYRKAIIIILFIGLAIPSLLAQDMVETTVREKVVFYTDRDLYLTGEPIWFKAMVSIDKQEKQQLSNVLYLELYLHNQAVVKKKFQIVNGRVEGMLAIPEEIHSANYYLRAYTQYQRNFPAGTFFTSLLTIINPEIPYQRSKTRPEKTLEIIPEGGLILNRLPAKIALRMNTNLVKIIEESRLSDQFGNTISSFEFAGNGLALLTFVPVDSLHYFLKFKLNNGDTVSEALPKSIDNGIVLSEDSENHEVSCHSGAEYLKNNDPSHRLLVYNQEGKVVEEKTVLINKASQSMGFAAAGEAGFYQLVLLNSKEETVAFTSIYRQPQVLSLKLNTQKINFSPREAVQLNIGSVKGQADFPAGLTVSVAKQGTVLLPAAELPLTVVENPILLPALADLNSRNDPALASQIKTVLILNRKAFQFHRLQQKHSNKTKWLAETRDVSLSGIVRNAKTKEALANVWVFAAVLGKDAQFHAYKSREDGLFVFSLNHLNNTHELSVSMDSIAGVEAEFLIFNDFSDSWPAAKDIPLKIDSAQQSLLESMLVNYQLAKMFRKKEKLSAHFSDSLPFPFTDVQASVYLKDFVALPTMPEVINELIPYVNVRKRKGKHVLAVVDQNRKNVYDHPLILIDNLPVFNVDEILAINPAKIERVDVIGKVYSFGDLLIKGIVMFHTKTDDFAGIQLPSSLAFVDYQTITPSASVEFPVYHPQATADSHSPDFKNLLYWNPSVPFTGNDTTLTFFTADEMSGYEIIVRGNTADGKPVFGKKEIRVE